MSDEIEDLQQFLEATKSGGWDSLDKIAERVEARRKRQEAMALRICDFVYPTFATEPGQLTLGWLKSRTVDRGTWAGGLQLPADVIMPYGLFREGQNSIYAMIRKAMEMAERGPPPGQTAPDSQAEDQT